jgi:hypothetical protein
LNATPLARLALALAYPVLAHLASLRDDPVLAAIALGDLAVFVLLDPLLHRRAWAWLVLLATIVGLVTLAPAALHWCCLVGDRRAGGVDLRAHAARGHVPLITRMSARSTQSARATRAGPARYTRALTATWAACSRPAVLRTACSRCARCPAACSHSSGIAPPHRGSARAWSWFANGLNYGLVGGLFVGEYFYRVRRFPGATRASSISCARWPGSARRSGAGCSTSRSSDQSGTAAAAAAIA